MYKLHLVPANTKIPFLRVRRFAFAFSILLMLGSVAAFFVNGLNYGIDFRGGTLIEIKTNGPADLAKMRSDLGALNVGEVSIQEFGAPDDVLIRIQQQDGDEEAQQETIGKVKDALKPVVKEFRRTEYVGPKVGGELKEAGTLAVLLAMAAILLYVWFRFEWQFGVGAVVALAHDVIATIGLFALLQLDFNLSTLAAILTIAGYSINDTVVVFDRVRENLRRYKKESLISLLNRSINDTLSRTVLTSITTLLALLALYFFGGDIIRGFAFAMIWGVIIGTYSSIFVAAPVLTFLNLDRTRKAKDEEEATEAAAEAKAAKDSEAAAGPA